MLLLDISNEYRHGVRERMAERNKLLNIVLEIFSILYAYMYIDRISVERKSGKQKYWSTF